MLFILVAPDAIAESDAEGLIERPLFASDSIIAVSIEGPLRTITRDRSESEELSGILRYTDAAGTEHVFDIQLRARGKFRRKKDVCGFPPLRVNFKTRQLEGTDFQGQDKLKLVTDCQSRKNFQQLLLHEYLAYRLMNVLTDYSFRARLLTVTYIDTESKNKARQSFAFFIEDEKHIAERIGMKLLKLQRTKYSALNTEHANLVNVYEYFIGNTDFSLVAGPKEGPCCHNAVLYQRDAEPIITIPYDFDHAGIVNAPYASPNPRFKISKVTQRRYRGRCSNNAHLDATFQRFLVKRDDIRQLVEQQEGYDNRSIKRTLAYVDSFYRSIADTKSIERHFIKKCW